MQFCSPEVMDLLVKANEAMLESAEGKSPRLTTAVLANYTSSVLSRQASAFVRAEIQKKKNQLKNMLACTACCKDISPYQATTPRGTAVSGEKTRMYFGRLYCSNVSYLKQSEPHPVFVFYMCITNDMSVCMHVQAITRSRFNVLSACIVLNPSA